MKKIKSIITHWCNRHQPVYHYASNPWRLIRVYRHVAGLCIVEWHNLARWPKGRTWKGDIPLIADQLSQKAIDKLSAMSIAELRRIFR